MNIDWDPYIGTFDALGILYDSHEDSCFQEPEFMTNTSPINKPIWLLAAERTGYNIYFKDKAVDERGQDVTEYIGMYSRDKGRDHSPFWAMTRKLKMSDAIKDRIKKVL